MTKHSEYERRRRASEAERVTQIQQAWQGSLPSDVAAKFAAQVRAAKERGPLPPPPDMPPGTAPRPPRPGHEPKPPKVETRPRRGR